ncbi:glutathione S-transferase family protein [Candidatus Binatia bacterium]|nr:glutathione S-transferase family protein [Candidatus Binatia bacterium]
MNAPVRIIGSYLSPYVRKVLAVLVAKGIPYEIDPIVPFLGDDRFAALSPLRRVPVLIDDRATLCDSSVICQYLEDRHPEPALYPADVVDRARARWLEEFADSRMGDVFIWRYFNQLVIRRFVWGEEPDHALVQRTLADDVPQVLDYLESQAPADGFVLGVLSIADVSVASFFRNAAFARFSIDAARWPRTAAWIARVHASPPFAALRPFEECLLATPLPRAREALAAIGAPLTHETYGTSTPRRGVMPI